MFLWTESLRVTLKEKIARKTVIKIHQNIKLDGGKLRNSREHMSLDVVKGIRCIQGS